jgi:hypothetical protein
VGDPVATPRVGDPVATPRVGDPVATPRADPRHVGGRCDEPRLACWLFPLRGVLDLRADERFSLARAPRAE